MVRCVCVYVVGIGYRQIDTATDPPPSNHPPGISMETNSPCRPRWCMAWGYIFLMASHRGYGFSSISSVEAGKGWDVCG